MANPTDSAPLVSFVIPVFNGTDYLKEAIDSALAQSFRNFEVIVVDDGSTDNTWRLIESYGSTVCGIHKPNGGTASALNRGILEARGKYIAWLSHDDRALPDKLAAQLQALASNSPAVGVYSDYYIINSQGERMGRYYMPWYEKDEMLRHFLQSMFINGSTTLIERARLIERGLFDETLRYGNDSLMWLRLLEHHELAHVAEALTEYRVHQAQGSQKKRQAVIRDHVRWLRIFVEECDITDFFPELKKCPQDHHQRAVARCYIGDVLERIHYQGAMARQQYAAALRDERSPFNPAVSKWLTTFVRPTARRARRALQGIYRVAVLKQPFRPPSFPQGDYNLRTNAEMIPTPRIICQDARA